MDFPKRKNLRLMHFDYSSDGYYFITLCTVNRQKTLCDIVGDDAHIIPTEYGKTVEKYIKTIRGIDKYVIMPNHIHLIIKNEKATTTSPAHAEGIGQKIKSFKILVTKNIGKPIFQRLYYDHIIRNEDDYLRVWEYIDTNPQKWAEDKYHTD